MSRNLFSSGNGRLHVTSYAGPANTLERTRVRLQFTTNVISPDEIPSIGFNDVVALREALDRWIAEHNKEKEK